VGNYRAILWLLPIGAMQLQSCFDKKEREPKPYHKPLEVIKLSEQSYLHVSYIKTDSGNFIPCNGYIYANAGKAIIFDTPLNDSISNQLINFVTNDLGLHIEGVVLNHFHEDASGGIKAFIEADIPSYSHEQTATLLEKDSVTITHSFTTNQKIALGNKMIENFYPGEAHSTDNIVSYISSEAVLYGGCMIKALNASKGNLDDANEQLWSETVARVESRFSNVNIVIPGHGQIGGKELLEYTIRLFTPPDLQDEY